MSRANPLTPEEANQIGGAIAELNAIGTSKIITQENEAKKAGLHAFLVRTLLEHADELIANWYAVRLEYEPLVNGFAGLLTRASAIMKRRADIAAEQQKKVAEAATPTPSGEPAAPSNVIQLPRS